MNRLRIITPLAVEKQYFHENIKLADSIVKEQKNYRFLVEIAINV